MSAPINSNFWEQAKYRWLIFFAWMIAPGIGLFFWGLFLTPSTDVLSLLPYLAGGFLLMMPCFIHLQLLAIWHWRERYIGNHSKLWGALFIFETTGWFKLIYFFRHIVPDRHNQGRYLRVAPPPISAGENY